MPRSATRGLPTADTAPGHFTGIDRYEAAKRLRDFVPKKTPEKRGNLLEAPSFAKAPHITHVSRGTNSRSLSVATHRSTPAKCQGVVQIDVDTGDITDTFSSYTAIF